MFDVSLSVAELGASRGGFALFENVSFHMDAGNALRITGPNGSGKTTLLRCLAGLIRADHGTVSTLDDGALHYLGHMNAMRPQFTVAENLLFWAKLDGNSNITIAVETLNLARLIDVPFHVLSSGQKRRVALARLLLSPRAIWLLDEPTVGLDLASVSIVEKVLETHLGEGGIVIGATHTPLGKSNWQALELQPVKL